MKIKYLIFTPAFLLLICSTLLAQSYTVYQSLGDDSDDFWSGAYPYNFDWTTANNNTVMSAKYDLPFTWYFYGNPVTDYYLSENGYITFGSAGNSIGANLTLPNPGAPNNSIFAFWDDFDWHYQTSMKTWGRAPNRVHEITWYNHPFILNPSDELSFHLRLFESCGDFEVRIQSYIGSSASGTIGCQNSNGSLGTQVSGSPNISFPQLAPFDDADDIIYVFQYNGAIERDLAVIKVEIDNHLANGTHTLKGTIRNRGNQTVTSYDINYSINGGQVFTSTISGVNIRDNDGLDNFTHSIPLTVSGATGQQLTLKVWPGNVNGIPDERSCNDTITKYLTNINNTGSPKNVLLEKFTGAWCGYCPDGSVYIQEILDDYPNTFIPIEVHDEDAMAFQDSLRIAFSASEYPRGLVNRKQFSSGDYKKEDLNRGVWAARVASELQAFSPASLSITPTYNSQTREVNATVDVNYSDYSAGNNRIVLMVLEDSLVGSGWGWDQANNYSSTPGHPYEGLGSPIAGFVHRHVLREYIDSGPFGTPGIVPNFVAPNSVISQQFQFTLSTDYEADHVYLVAALVHDLEGNDPKFVGARGNREVFNSTQVNLLNPTLSVAPVSAGDFKVYPNPAQSFVKVEFSEDFLSPEKEVFITNLQGAIIRVQRIEANYGQIDIGDLSKGLYFIGIEINGSRYLKKLVVQ